MSEPGSVSDFPLALLPNPATPLAFLPPNIADTVQVAAYVIVGSTGMFLWDILVNISMDRQLLLKHKITLPTVVYFISRLCSLGFLLTESVYFSLTVPLSDCLSPIRALEALFFVGMAATNLLFFFRIRAIYNRNPWVKAAFFLLWLANVGCSSTEFLLVEGIHIGPTGYCIFFNAKIIYAVIPGIAVLVHDTIIFIAISVRLYTHSQMGVNGQSRSFRTSTKNFLSGRKLPRFSRALLVDGQVYYLISFLTTAVVVAMLVVPSFPLAYHLMMIGPHMAIVNSMACQVYRSVRFGVIREGTISTTSVISGGSRASASRTASGHTARPGINLLPIHTANTPSFHYKMSDPNDPGQGVGFSPSSPTSKYGAGFP